MTYRGRRHLAAFLLLGGFFISPVSAEEITVWAMGEEGKQIQVLARKFERENPGVQVNTQAIPWEAAHEKLLTSVVGNIPPDVCQLGTTWMAEFSSMGALEELSPWIKNSKIIQPGTFFPGSWNTCVVGGGVQGVPWYVDTRVLFYRKDLLKQVGYANPPATWVELKVVSSALKLLPGLPSPHFALALGLKDWGGLLMFVWQNGGHALMPRTQKFREALDFYVSFFREGLSPGDTAQDVDLIHAFRTGYFPMFISGPWMVDMIQKEAPDLEGKWGVAVLPRQERATSFIGGSNLVIFERSRHKETAWKFMEFMSRPEVQVEWYRIMKDLPSNREAWAAPDFVRNEFLQVFGMQLRDTEAPPNIPEWEEVAQAIGSTLEKVILSKKPAVDVWLVEMDQLQLVMDTILQKRQHESAPASPLKTVVTGVLFVAATAALFLWLSSRRRVDSVGGSPQKDSRAGYFFILPASLILLVFLFGPICVSFLLSLTNLDVFGINKWENIRFIGLQNYISVLHDPVFWKSLVNTLYFAGVGVPLTIVCSLVAAVALNQAFVKGRTFFRILYFAPVVTTIVAVAVVWRWLYNPDYGLLNWGLRMLSLPPLNWLNDARTALFSLILMAVWKNFGYNMVIFSAGLQTIPEHLYEAAKIDGASPWQCFRYITVPGLRPTTLFVTVLTIITYLQFFAEPYIMTKGGPLDSTNSIVLYMYNNGFKFFKLGYASAVAYILFGIIFLLTLTQMPWKKDEANR